MVFMTKKIIVNRNFGEFTSCDTASVFDVLSETLYLLGSLNAVKIAFNDTQDMNIM